MILEFIGAAWLFIVGFVLGVVWSHYQVYVKIKKIFRGFVK